MVPDQSRGTTTDLAIGIADYGRISTVYDRGRSTPRRRTARPSTRGASA